MDVLEQRLIDVDGARLEVFLGGSDGPLVCQSHPFVPLSADPLDPASGGWTGTRRWGGWSASTPAASDSRRQSGSRAMSPLPNTSRIWRRCASSLAASRGSIGAPPAAASLGCCMRCGIRKPCAG